MRRRAEPRRGDGRGLAYPALLFVLAMLALWSTAAAPVWERVARAEREQELLFAGQQIRDAIDRYRRAPTRDGRTGEWPRRLEDLLRDERGPVPRHHLRRPYRDPVGLADWGLLLTADGGIAGVYSRSTEVPLRRSGFPPGLAFEGARSYRDWRFAVPGATTQPPPGTGAGEGAAPPAEAPPEDPPPVPQPRPPRPSDYDARTPAACARIEAYDRVLCQQVQAVAPAAGATCLSSAAQRAAVCPFPESFPLPALILGPR